MFTPLAFAATGQHIEIVKYLLTIPEVDLNVLNTDHQSALTIAIIGDASRIARLLLADPRIDVDDFLGPVYHAARLTRTSLFLDIVSRPGFDCSMRGPHNETMLHLLTTDIRVDLLKAIMNRPEVDINAVDEMNETPLSRACALGSGRVVRELLSCDGIDVNHTDNMGWTPLHYACYSGVTEVIVPLLMRPEMDINAVTNSGLRPIHLIVNQGLVDALTAICWRTDLEVDVFTRGSKPLTPLMICAHTNRPDLMRILLRYPGIDPHIRSSTGNSAHRIACKHRYHECAQLTKRVVPVPPEPKPKRRATLMTRRSATLVMS
jgi:ankyrin repeat protein